MLKVSLYRYKFNVVNKFLRMLIFEFVQHYGNSNAPYILSDLKANLFFSRVTNMCRIKVFNSIEGYICLVHTIP